MQIARISYNPNQLATPTATRARRATHRHRVVQCRGSSNRHVDANGSARCAAARPASASRLRVTPSASSDYEREISARADEAFALDELNGNGRRRRERNTGAVADVDDSLTMRVRGVTTSVGSVSGQQRRRRTGKSSQAQGPTLGLVTVPRTRTGRRSGGGVNPLRALFESL